MHNAALVLADGAVFPGRLAGKVTQAQGEVVFNTAMTGYQEILTDPSYCGQIVVMTYPLIGNYGVNKQDVEAARPFVRGFVAREFCAVPSNWRAEENVNAFLDAHGIAGLVGVDTRALTRHIRRRGAMPGRIVAGAAQDWNWQPYAEDHRLVEEVAVRERRFFRGGGAAHVVILDCGVKQNIIRSLLARQCDVSVVNPFIGADEIMALRPDGVLVSNGPGDPQDVPQVADTVRRLLGRTVVFGICLGHQILALACGGRTYKLKFGHRGANHPVKNLVSGRVYVTSQNHGYAVAADNLPSCLKVTEINLNDHTVEGLTHTEVPAFSVQYHPEASPGPHDAAGYFHRFLAAMAAARGCSDATAD